MTITPHLPLLAWAFPDSSSIAYSTEPELQQCDLYFPLILQPESLCLMPSVAHSRLVREEMMVRVKCIYLTVFLTT